MTNHWKNEEGLRELGLFSLEKKRLQGDPIVALKYLTGVRTKEGEGLFTTVWSDRTRGKGFKQRDLDKILGNILYCGGGKALKQVAERNCGCPTTVSLQEPQAGCRSGQPGLVKGVPSHGRGGVV